MPRRFRIHPSIGVARVGNAPEEHFIGPESPGTPANWDGSAFSSFRDGEGRIKRQAARFRIFAYEEDAQGRLSAPAEVSVGGDIVDIEWRVHVANRKASFFTFNGQSGAPDAYVGRSNRPAADPEKEDPDTPRANKRNPQVPDAERSRLLEIDPGEQVISASHPQPVVLKNPNANVAFISDLGELRLDDARLLFLGGHGTSGSTSNPPVQIDEYANNDTWFDDVSDGSVKARLRFANGTVADADPAWVVVGPPDFAPGVGNVVSMYDLLWDLAVRKLPAPDTNALFVDGALRNLGEQQQAWHASGERSLAGYRPSFLREIYPLLTRAFAARWTFEPHEIDRGSFHVALLDWDTLAQPDSGSAKDEGRKLREYVLGKIRNPSADKIDWTGMPRSLGDDYDHLETDPRPTSLMSLTHIQYALLEQWAEGHFISDWPGSEPGIPAPGAVTPEGLDRAALENSVGGPFYPGIEVSWLIRRTEIYSEPFRLKIPAAPANEVTAPELVVGAVAFRPGFFSQQMALPWQADFYDCHKEEFESADNNPRVRYYMWWTAQRPDDVFVPGRKDRRSWVKRFDDRGATADTPERFNQMQQHWPDLHFLIWNGERYEEEP